MNSLISFRICSSFVAPLPVNAFPNIVVTNVPNNVERDPSFCSFASSLIVFRIPFITNPNYSTDLTIFIITSISSIEIINEVIQNFLRIGASVAAAAVNPNEIKTLLANGVSTFFINGKLAVINCLQKLRNLPS